MMRRDVRPPLFGFALALAERQVFTHDATGIGLFVRCARGTIRLVDPEGAVHVLAPGDRWGTTRRGRLALEALTSARVELEVALAPVRSGARER